MTSEDPVRELLEKMLEASCTPEQACETSPELLPEVRRRWEQLRYVRHEVEEFFAAPPSIDGESTNRGPTLSQTGSPQIRGYDVQGLLGSGGMGLVYRARHLKLNRIVALKMMISGAYAGPNERARFQREALAIAGLQHPNIVQIFEVGDWDGRPYFSMEYVDGGSLAQKLSGTPQPAQQAATVVATLARAVQSAHQGGIVHRDLKPANVLLTVDGMPKITDFGLARRFDSDDELTLTGARIGTPSYMAPEQAAGKINAIGPATDVYALGAVLYEMLCGRPPFRAETAIETERQVVTDDPLPPSRLNLRIPRDLETICLKCLEKDPARRYATAAALADDLQRFQDGNPVAARRAGVIERAVKWVNRRRALSAAIVAGAVLVVFILTVTWRAAFELAVLVRAVETDFGDVVDAQRRSAWLDARTALERAKARIGHRTNAKLHLTAKQFERELDLVKRLDGIAANRSSAEDVALAATAYKKAFGEAGIIEGHPDPTVVAAQIRSRGIAPAVILALDDWSLCDGRNREWLMEIARQVDPSPLSQQIRNAKLWDDKTGLEKLANDAPIVGQPVNLLVHVGKRLNDLRSEVAEPFLTRVQEQYPDDFWVNYILSEVLRGRKHHAESIRYLQAAMTVRPNAAVLHNALGMSLGECKRKEEALTQFQIAVRLDPEALIYRFNFGLALHYLGRYDESIREFRQAEAIDPKSGRTIAGIGSSLVELNRHPEAISEFRRAISVEPKCWDAHRRLRSLLLKLNQWDEARILREQTLQLTPPDHEDWDGYAELCLFLGREDEYRRARQQLLDRFGNSTDPPVGERTGRACLLLPGSDDDLRKATALIDRALSTDPDRYRGYRPYFLVAKAMAEYRADRLDNARKLLDGDVLAVLGPMPRLVLAMTEYRLGQTGAAKKALARVAWDFDWTASEATNREAWMYHIVRREAESLILPRIPAFLEGSYHPQDNDERLGMLAVCQFKELHGAAAGLYLAAFAADSTLADDFQMARRYRAARAAALVGCGRGADGPQLNDAERARWRRQACAWLDADLAQWTKLASGPNLAMVKQKLSVWRNDPHLAGIREPVGLQIMPEDERTEFTALWNNVAAIIGR